MKEKAKYEGAYADGKKNGVVKMTYPEGDNYHGEWKDNKMEGEGTYTYVKTKDIYLHGRPVSRAGKGVSMGRTKAR